MVKSPFGVYGGAGGSGNLSATKAKAHAAQNGVDGTSSTHQTSSSRNTRPELAEQLNEETRRKYVKGKSLGAGTYATVYRGHLRTDPSQLFAIKKMKVNAEYKDGLTMDAIREVKFLQELSHPNIIALHSVYSSKNQNLCLVLEYLPLGDLEMLIRDSAGVHYGLADIKAWMGMLGRAVWFCHENFVLHRDIKPNNLLIAADGEMKLADFGLARSFADPYAPMTHQVITRWYRPPELFYRAKFYSGAVDMWSVGLVFAELLLRRPWIQGDTDIQTLQQINTEIGSPLEENWPGVSKLEGYVVPTQVVPVKPRQFYMGLFSNAGTAGVNLLMSMLKLDPRKRPTARRMLQHEFWTTEPRPSNKEDLPRKSGGEKKMGEDLKRRGVELEQPRGDKVARKIDFSKKK